MNKFRKCKMKVAAVAADIMLTVVDMNIRKEKGFLSVLTLRGRKASRADYTKNAYDRNTAEKFR